MVGTDSELDLHSEYDWQDGFCEGIQGRADGRDATSRVVRVWHGVPTSLLQIPLCQYMARLDSLQSGGYG